MFAPYAAPSFSSFPWCADSGFPRRVASPGVLEKMNNRRYLVVSEFRVIHPL
jgi:hypothetical protein